MLNIVFANILLFSQCVFCGVGDLSALNVYFRQLLLETPINLLPLSYDKGMKGNSNSLTGVVISPFKKKKKSFIPIQVLTDNEKIGNRYQLTGFNQFFYDYHKTEGHTIINNCAT